MKLFKNLVALCLAALMVFGAGCSVLLDAFGTASLAVTAEGDETRKKVSDTYFEIWYRSDSDEYDGPDISTEKYYYAEDDQPVEIKDVDEVFDEDDYDGWEFLYWKYGSKKVYPGDEIDDADKNEAVKLYAVWEEGDDGDYKVTYKIGEAGDADNVIKYVDGDFTAPKIDKVFDEDDYGDWEFLYWEVTKGDSDYVDETYKAGKTIPEEAFNSKDELTLTAIWDESDTCTVKYASGNSKATGTTPATETVDYGDSITLPSNPYTLTGYTFAGWDVDGTAKKAGDKVTIKKSLTITAKWAAAANVTLTYSPGKGAGTAYTKTYTAGTSTKLDTNSFTRDGYTFIGWWIGSVGKTYSAGTSVTINGNDTATAQWTAIVTSQPEASQPAASQPEASVPESSSEAPSETETSSEPESTPEEETPNTLSYTISGETPVSGISAVLDEDLGNAQLWVTAINGSNAADNTTAALIDSGDAVAAFDLSLLVDGSTYSDAVAGTVSFEMQGSAGIPDAPYDDAVIAVIHVVSLDKFTGKGYYLPDGKKALYFNSESGEESEVKCFGFQTENGVSRIIIKDSGEAPDEFAYLSEPGTIVEVRLFPNANADTFDIDFTSLSPFLISWVELNESAGGGLPLWVWIAIGGALIFAILVVILLVVRGRNAKAEQMAAERLTRREPPQKAMAAKEAAPAAPHYYNDEAFERAPDFDAKKGFDVATAGKTMKTTAAGTAF